MFAVGNRVRDGDGFRATIRYIGPVAAAKNKEEVWLGVEWDDASRGKHDGSCLDGEGKLVRYFTCAYGAGSFIKPAKIVPGRSLVEALHDRYVTLDAPSISKDAALPEAYFTTSKGNQKSIEFVGEEKIRRHQQLSAINKFAIRNDTVSTIGENFHGIAGHMIEADLQDNLLSEWSEIFKLGRELPQLQTLLLHGNKLETLSASIAETLNRDSFISLTVLALNGCNLRTWAELQLLEPFLPSLEELYAAHNSFTDLPRESYEQGYRDATGDTRDTVPSVSGFDRLRILDLSYCNLEEWSQVQAFGHLTSLQELVLDGNNKIVQVVPPHPDTFHSLVRMSLSGTGLEAWSDIDTLAGYPLQFLRITNIPLFRGKGASEVRPLIIARVHQLQVLNGSKVGPREREDSEKTYLRSMLREKEGLQQNADKTEEDILRAFSIFHPRFRELYERFGLDATAEARSAAGTSIAAELLNITFRNLSFGSNGSLEPITKKLPRTMIIGKVKLLVKQLFGLEPRLQQLSLRVYKDSVPTLLEDEQSTLSYYGALDGAEIFINEDKA